MARRSDLSRLNVVFFSRRVEVPVHTSELRRMLRQNRAGWTDRSPN